MTARNKVLFGVGIGVAILATLLLTVWNKRWWIGRAERKWKLERSVVDGVAWLRQPYLPREEFREDYLLKQPFRRLRELYDTGGLKEPAPIGETITQEAPTA
jgi:hypothetical protein